MITIDDDSSPILKYLDGKTIGELKGEDLVGEMYLTDVMTTEEINGSRVLKALNELPNPEHDTDPSAPATGCKVNKIGERVNELKLEDVIDCDEVDSKIIKTLRHKRVDELSTAIDELLISDVMDYYYEESTGKYWTDNTKTDELSPVLVKLIGNEPFGHEYPGYEVTGGSYTINREIGGKDFEYVRFVDKNGEDYKVSGYYKINDFLQNTTITVSKHVETVDDEEVVTWVANGSGTASPARDPYATSFDVNIVWPSEWTGDHYVNVCNKPTRVNDFGDAVSDLKLKDVMTIEPGSVFDKPKIKNSEISDADTLFDNIKEELSIGDLVDHYEYPADSGVYYSTEEHLPEDKLPQILCTFIKNDTKLDDLTDAINDLKFGDVVENYEYPEGSHVYYSDPEHTQKLPQILNTFVDEGVEINDMANRIKLLTIGDALSAEDRDNKFLNHIPEDTLITDMGDAINNIKILDAFEDEIYDGGEMKPTWKYLLLESEAEKAQLLSTSKAADPFNRAKYVENPDTHTNNAGTIVDGKYVFKCNAYTIGDSMGQMIDNMSTMMEAATLIELQRDEIVDVNDGKAWDDPTGFLMKAIPSPLDAYTDKTYFGELTIAEFAALINHL